MYYWLAYTGERAMLNEHNVLMVVTKKGIVIYSPNHVYRRDDGDITVLLDSHGRGWRLVTQAQFEEAGGLEGKVLL